MHRSFHLTLAPAVFLASVAHAQKNHAQKPVIIGPPATTAVQPYHDTHFGVRFSVPAGWDFTRKDGLVSTFRLDARSAVAHSQLRAVAGLDVNPFPLSTLSGALFYYSVEPHTTDRECEHQATKFAPAPAEKSVDLQARTPASPSQDIQNIGGMNFLHGHDEHGGICIEARDEVYTAFHKGSCYRFDLEVNTFCAVTSGALELDLNQFLGLQTRMTNILSTVVFDWEKSGPHLVSPPSIIIQPEPPPPPGPTSPAAL